MAKKATSTSKKKKQTRAKNKPITIHIKNYTIKKSVLVGIMRGTLSGFTFALLLFAFQKPVSEKGVLSESTINNTAPSVFEKELGPTIVPPDISAASYIVVSTKKNKILAAKNSDVKLPPASTTKILTGLLAIQEFDFEEVVEVPAFCTKLEGSKIGLAPGEKINVESLLYGLLVASAGDAACTLSAHKFSSGTFIVKMNILAKQIGLTNTNFNNVVGFDTEEETHVSTARDLYLMTREAMKNGVFRKIVGTEETTIYSDDLKFSHHIRSTNQLLFEVPGTLGVKTGKTPKAKEVLVYSYQKNGDEIITVVMGSDDRFGDTKELINFVNTNYQQF